LKIAKKSWGNFPVFFVQRSPKAAQKSCPSPILEKRELKKEINHDIEVLRQPDNGTGK